MSASVERDITESPLEYYTKKLVRVSDTLKFLSTIIIFITLFHISMPAYVFTSQGSNIGPFRPLDYIWIDFFVLSAFLLFAFAFEKSRKTGRVLYQEVSDDLENGIPKGKTAIEFRVALRNFVIESSLPFLSGEKISIFAYLGMNVFLSAVIWVLIELKISRA